MPIKTTVTTPLGTFSSVAAAARAHHMDRITLHRRFETDPENFRKTVTEYKTADTTKFVVRGVRWPIPWTQYRFQSEDVKDAIYQAWCVRAGLDPDQEHTADAFFADMDGVGDQDSELDTDLDAETNTLV